MTKPPYRYADEKKLVELALQLASDGLERGAQISEQGMKARMPHVSADARAKTLSNIRTGNALAHKKIAAHLLRSAAALLDKGTL